MPSRLKNWITNQSTNVIDIDAARSSRERQEARALAVAEKRAAAKKRRQEAEALQIAFAQKRRVKPKKKFQESQQWREARYAVLKRDGSRCRCCGRTPSDGVKVHVDHIKPKSRYPELALDLSNLQVLCEDCNLGKGVDDETDWRASG